MATRTTVATFDDLTGEEGAAKVTFALEGAQWEIDLTAANRDGLIAALQPYLDGGRRVRNNGQGYTAARRASAGSRGYNLAELRAWAGDNGIEVPSRGRIPAVVVEQYLAQTKK